MVRIPRTEAQVGFSPTMQPTWSGESAAAVGRAVQGLGNAIGGLGDAFQGEMNQQNEFKDKLEVMKFQNSWEQTQNKDVAEFNRDNPDGYATERYGAYRQGAAELIPKLKSPKMQQWATLHLENHGSNVYERYQKFEYGKRSDMIYRETDTAITNEFGGPGMDDPNTISDAVTARLDGIEAIIKSAPMDGSRKEALRKSAADLAFKKIQATLTAADRGDEAADIAKGILQRYGTPTQVPGPQSQGPTVQPRTSGWIPKNVIFHDYGGNPKNADGVHNPYHALVFPDGSVRYRNPDDPYGTKAPHAAGMNNVAVGIAYAGPVGSKPTPQALASLQKEYDTVQQMFPGIAAGEGHGEAYQRTKGTPQQASRDGRDLIEASWRSEMKRGVGAPASGQASQGPVPMAQRGITSYAGMAGGNELTPKLTAYAPQAGGSLAKMEGGYAAAKPGPDGKAEVRTLEDVQAGRSPYITIAGDPSQYGKSYTIPEITWVDSKGQQHVSKNVKAVVHDTGSAFKGAGDSKFDIPVARDLSNAQMAAQPFLKGGVKLVRDGGQQQSAPQKGGILTSLDDSPTPDEIAKSGASILDFDFAKPGAKTALAAAKKAGVKVAAYHEGAGGGASWGEGSRDLTSPVELKKLGDDAKKLAAQGADYLHVDNLHDMKPDQLAQVAKAVKDATGGKVSIIAKNNLQAWVDIIQKNPDLKPPYAVVEHGMKDPAQQAAAKKLHDMGVPVHFMEFADPGTDQATKQKRKDPTSTPEEADAFVKANPWANVVHMKTQDSYNGREAAGAKVFRAPNTIPTAEQAGSNKVADASGQTLPRLAPQSAHTQLNELLQRHMPSLEAQSEVARQKWVKGIEGKIKTVIDLTEKGYAKDSDLDAIEQVIASKPALAKQAGIDNAIPGLRQYVEEAGKLRVLRPNDLAGIIQQTDAQLKAADIPPEVRAQALKRKEGMSKLLGEMRKGVNEDPLSWADRTGVAPLQPIDWKNPESLANRVTSARTVAEHYGQAPQFFTKDERESLKDQLKVGGKPMLGMLGAMSEAFGPDMIHAMGEISKQAPEAATIGWMMTAGISPKTVEDAAIGMERQQRRAMGEKGITPIKPVEGRQAFIDTVGTAFSRMPSSEGALTETVASIYEARAQRGGWTEPKPEEWKKALREVVGESTDKQGSMFGGFQEMGGGHKIILPPNVKNAGGTIRQATFYSLMDSVRPEDLIGPMGNGPMSGNGTPLSIAAIRKATPVSVGDGRYFLAMGTPTGDDPMFITDGTGKNFVLDLKALEPKLKVRRPDLYKGYEAPEGIAAPPIAMPTPTGN